MHKEPYEVWERTASKQRDLIVTAFGVMLGVAWVTAFLVYLCRTPYTAYVVETTAFL